MVKTNLQVSLKYRYIIFLTIHYHLVKKKTSKLFYNLYTRALRLKEVNKPKNGHDQSSSFRAFHKGYNSCRSLLILLEILNLIHFLSAKVHGIFAIYMFIFTICIIKRAADHIYLKLCHQCVKMSKVFEFYTNLYIKHQFFLIDN